MEQMGDSREQRVLSLRHGRHRAARTNSTSAIPPPTGTHHSNTMLRMTEATTNNSNSNGRPEEKADPLASTFTEMQQTLKDRGQQQSTAPSASSVRDASLLILTRNERGRVVPSSHSLVQHPPQPPLSLTSPSAPRGGGEVNITANNCSKGSNAPVGSYAPHGEPCNVAPRRLPQLTRLNETVEPASLPLPRHTPPQQQQQQKETAVNTNYNTTTSSSGNTQPATTSNTVVASSPPLRPSARVLTRCPSSGPACLPPRRRTRSCMWAMPEFHSTHHSSFTSGSSGGMTTATYVNVPEAGSGFLRVKLYNNNTTTTTSTGSEKHGQWCLVPNTVTYEEFCQLIRQRCEATQGGSNHSAVVSFTNAGAAPAAADSTSAEEVSAGALASRGSPRKPVSAVVMSGLPASPTVQAAMKLYYTVDGGVAPGTSQATNSASTNSNNTTSNNSSSSNGMMLLDKAEFTRLTQARGPGLSFGALNIHVFAGGNAEPEAEQVQQQQQRSSLHASLLQRSDSLSNTAKSQPEMSHTTSMSLAQTVPPPATTTTTTTITTHTPPRSVHDVYLSSKRNSEGGHGGNITRGTNMQQILSSSLEGGLNLSNMMPANSTSIENGLSWYINNNNNNTNTSSGAQVRAARHHERHPHYSQEVRNSLSLPSNTPKTDNVHGRLSQSSGGNGMYLSLLKEKLELQHTHHHNNNNNTASHGGPSSHTTSHAKTPYTAEKINTLSGTHTPGYNTNTTNNTTARHALESDRMSDVVNGLDSSSDEESKGGLHTEKDEMTMMMRPLRSALQSNNNNNTPQPSLLIFPQRLNSAPVVRTTNMNTTNNTSNSSGNGEATATTTSYMPLYTEGRGHNHNNAHVSEAAEVPLVGVLRHAHFFTLQAPQEQQQALPQQIEARTPPHRGMSNKARHRSGHNHTTTTTTNNDATSSNNTVTKNSNSKELGHHRTSNRALQVQPTSADERTAIHPAVDEAAAANIVITSAEGGTTTTLPNTVMTTMELLGLPAKAPAENKRKKERSRRTGHNTNNDTVITTNETGKKETANEGRRRGRERTREVNAHHAAHDVESGRVNAEAEPTRMTSPPAPHDNTNTTSNNISNNNNVSNVTNHCVAVRQRLPSRRPASRPPGPGHSSQSQQYGYASPSFGTALGNSTSSAQAMSTAGTSYYLPRYDSSEMQWQRTLEALQRSQIVWRRIAVIGKGAYATVYEGVLQDGHHVAVKVLDVPHLTRRDLLSRSGTDDRGGSRRNAGDEMSESAAAGGGGGLSGPGPSVRRLVREINLMRHLKHPNIVGYIHCQVTKLWTDPIPPPPTAGSPMQRAPGRIQNWWFDYSNSNNVVVGESGAEAGNVKTPYSQNTNSSSSLLTLRAQPLQVEILMELCPGGSLAQRVRDSPARRLPMPQVRRYIRQVLCGLVYLHERGVIHRDIKADNVLISASGDAKLADFGCSRRIAAAAHGTSGPGCAMCSLRSPRANEDTNNDNTARREKGRNKERRDEYLDEDSSGSSIGAALLTPKTTLDLSNSTGRAFHHGGADVSVPQSVLTHQTVQQVAAGVALSQLDNRFMGTVSTLAHTMVGTPLFMAPEVILQDVESSSGSNSCMDKMRDPLMAPSTAASHRIIAPVRFSTDSEQVNMGTLVSELNETELIKKDEKNNEQGQQSSATNTMSKTEGSSSSSGGYAAPADVWAVGCLTLELLGRSPWPVQTAYGGALSYIQVILRIARAEKDKLPPGVPTNAPAPLYEFLQKALQRDPRQRATAQELLQLEWMRCPEEALEELT